ncbi:hypothetical protein C8F01DRAFT_258832 [Mycena amicta]|nr:hypothetical protein C8F01DRAFT_258832 [Mycena amicta]
MSSSEYVLPPELWALISSHSTRQSIARLCQVCRRFRSFLSFLYEDLLDPPLTASESLAFLRTYCDATAFPKNPHPALLIRQLALNDKSTCGFGVKCIPDDVLDKLPFKHMTAFASPLRVLHWNISCGINALNSFLSLPGSFPHLKELCVTCKNPSEAKNFSFMHKGGLDVVGIDITFNLSD